MKILIGTTNPGKIEGAKRALNHYFSNFEIEGVSVTSEVSDQPVNEEIAMGAKNRVKNLKTYAHENNINPDMFLAIESGINNYFGNWIITNVAIIEKGGVESIATSPSFPVPDRYVNEIINSDLSIVMNKIFSEDKERGKKGGGIQLLTHNKISRIDLTETAFIMALTKFINEDKWK